jgi:hypothetical protein
LHFESIKSDETQVLIFVRFKVKTSFHSNNSKRMTVIGNDFRLDSFLERQDFFLLLSSFQNRSCSFLVISSEANANKFEVRDD